MKVVLVWNGPANGSECDPLARRQVPLLLRLQAQGVSPVVALLGDRGGLGAHLEQAGLAVERLHTPLPPSRSAVARMLAAVVELRALFRRYAPDLVEGDEPMPAIATGLAARGRSSVIVYRRHHPGGGRRRLVLASRLAARLSSRTMVSSEAIRQHAATEDRVPLQRIDVTTSGMPELNLAPVEAARTRQSLGLEPDARVIVCVSRLRQEKGIDVLIASLPHLAAIRGLHVVVAGVGPEERALRILAAASRVPVHFVGHQRDVARWLAVGDVVALPSRRESLGRVTLEAMALGRPIVATRVGGLPEAIATGENGLLVPPDDPMAFANAIRALLLDSELATRLAAGARRAYESRYTIDHMATSWRKGWERAVAGIPLS